MRRIVKAIPLARSLYHHWQKLEYERRFSGDCYACFRGVYDNFEQAISSAPKTKKIGYNDCELAEEYQVELKTTNLRSYDYPVLFWLNQLLKENVKVFDFGGNVGIHFYLYEKYISYPLGLEWLVCDLPEIVYCGKDIAEKEEKQLIFTCEFEQANKADIFLASGSIQYVECLSVSLSKLSNKPQHLLINRLPLYDGDKFVTLQNGGKVFYPQYVFNKKEFIDSLENLGYELVDIWEDLVDSCMIPFYLEKSVPFYHGLYFKLRA